jgi:photosystem II stability/assembly factor-like uncharacterized protein
LEDGMTFPRAIPVLALITVIVLPFLSGLALAAESDAWTSGGPPGASVYAIAPAPSSPSIVYVGTGRGVWKGGRGGAGWQAASSGLPVDRVQAVAVDPSDSDVVYAGTITPFGVPSVGLFKTTDGGASWVEANNGFFDRFTLAEPLDVPAISVDPSNPQVIVAGTRFSEIFLSTNGGANWTPQTIGGAGLGLETTGFARDPSSPQRIYAASTIGLLLSVNGGVNWSAFGNAGITFFCVAVDPSSPTTVWAGNGFGFGIAKSLDSGATWQSANGNLPSVTSGGSTFFPAIDSVAVAPDGSAVYLATSVGLFRSTDGGTNWTALETGLNELNFHSVAFLPGQPPGTVLAGGDAGGVYRTTNAGADWSVSSQGLNESLVTEVVANPSFAGIAYAAATDGVYATTNGGASWARASGGLPRSSVAALALRFAVSLQPGDQETLFAGTLGDGLWSSIDGGTTWSPQGSGLDDQFVSALAVAPSNITILYAGTNHPGASPQRVYKSTDSGATWVQTGLDANGFPIDIVTIDPDDSSRVAAFAHGAGGYFQTENGGVVWRTVNPGSACGAVHAVAYEPQGDGVLVGVTNGVCRSENGGTTWTRYDVAPLSVVEDLLFDPDNSSVVYAAASPAVPGGLGGGVFQSTDGGRTWAALGTGLSTYSVRALASDASGSSQRLYAGIFRGGVATLAQGQPTRNTPEPPTPSDRETRVIERP